MMSLKKLVTLAFVCLATLTGCNSAEDEPQGKPTEVNFIIKVSASNGMQSPDGAAHKASRDYADATPGELIGTLRFIIVRPDGTVEHNRYYDFRDSETLEYEQKFVVQSGETKKVYLIANEETTWTNGTKVVNYDFDSILEGNAFPESDYKNILITLNSNSQELPLPLVMSECRAVAVPAFSSSNNEFSSQLFIVRAATKFTFNIINHSTDNFTINSLAIDKLARKQYFLPQSTTGETQYNDAGEVLDYIVPSIGNNEYYTFTKSSFASNNIPVGTTLTLDPIYLLEGKYTDAASAGKNYKITLTMNGGVDYSEYFPNLSQLPRNTHVVVNVTFSEKSVNWEAKIYPYLSVELKPGLGF